MNGLYDDKYIRAVLDNFSDMVFRIALNYTKNLQDAEDITQEVFLSLISREKFQDGEHLKAWLVRVTINKSINHYRKSKRGRHINGDFNSYNNLADADFELLEALDKLPQKDRTVIYLHYYEGYTAKEIGALLKMNEKAVAKRLSRARDKLKNYLT